MTDKLRDAAQQALEAYCRGWHKSFAAENPYDRISITDESRKHILAGLVEALASLAQQDAQAVPTQRQYEMALRQWDHWKSYALELQAKLVKYEGGSPMVLNASPTPTAQRDDTTLLKQCFVAIEAMMQEFKALDLPYGSKAYALAKDCRLDLIKHFDGRLTPPTQRVMLTDEEIIEMCDYQGVPDAQGECLVRAAIDAYERKNGIEAYENKNGINRG